MHVEAAQRWDVAREMAAATELRELSGTLEVDQGLHVSCNKGKGPELAPESTTGQESWKCDSCEWCGVEYVWLKASDSDLTGAELTKLQGGWKKSCKLCQELCIKCTTGEFWYRGKGCERVTRRRMACQRRSGG